MRLTTAMKDQIVLKVIADTTRKKMDELNKKERLLGDSLVAHLYAPYKEAMDKLPTNAFSIGTSVCVRFEGGYEYVSTNPHKKFNYNLQFETDRKSEIAEMVFAIKKSHQSIRDQESQIREELWQMLNSVTTVRRLLEVWPDGWKWINEVCNKVTPNLPAVTTDNLNKKLCLLLNDPESLPCKGVKS